MDDGTILFLDTLAKVSDNQLHEPAALPGWTGRHIVAHVHYNALALGRLTQWAATGDETPMYGSPEQRRSEIEHGATRPSSELRRLVHRSSEALTAALDGLSAQAWQTTVVTAQGRHVPATEIPWMRAREVFIHAIDLGTGTTFEDLPDDFLAALLADVVRKRAAAGEAPTLAAWLTGRITNPPRLHPWL